MARPRTFNELEVVDIAMSLFAQQGFNATSIDDLVNATGLLRGSLYKAFGSKLNLFLLGFKECAAHFDVQDRRHLDVLTVALRDLAATDASTRDMCLEILSRHSKSLALNLGNNLLQRMEK